MTSKIQRLIPRDVVPPPTLNRSECKSIAISNIDRNQFRKLDDAPLIDEKTELLIEHYKQNNAFPEMPVGREVSNRVELAYGHHVLEAAKRLGLLTLNIEIRMLDNAAMVTLMPTHSGPHVKPDIRLCIHAWMLARNSAQDENARQPTEIARQFGWVRPDPRRPDQPRLDDLASACHAAAEAIDLGLAKAHDFAGMPAYRAGAYAAHLRTRKWQKGLGFWVPEASRGIRRKAEVESVTAPLIGLSRPLEFNTRPKDMSILVAGAEGLTILIDRVLHDDELSEIGRHLSDLSRSHHALKAEKDRELVVRPILEALDKLIGRADFWKGRLADAKPKPRKAIKPS